MTAKDTVIRFLFPPVCMACGANVTEKEGNLCPDCRAAFDALFKPGFFLCNGGNGYADSMFSLFPYRNDLIRAFLAEYKRAAYEGNSAIFEEYGKKALAAMPFLSKADMVCYAPRSQQKRRFRFVDQSEDMAKTFSRFAGIAFEDLLYRRGLSLSQHRMKGKNRRRNVEGRFGARRYLAGEDVILIDDIVTTGASASEAARVLKAAGAMHVWVLCFAH